MNGYITFRAYNGSVGQMGQHIWVGHVHQWLKWFCEAGGGAHMTKPGWSKPHSHSNPTNLALFRHKIALYRFNQGGSYYCRGAQMAAGGLSPPPSPLQ